MDSNLAEDGKGKITKIAFEDMLGERFLEEARNIYKKSKEGFIVSNDISAANDNQTPRYNNALKDKILYPEMLDITHFYSHFIELLSKSSSSTSDNCQRLYRKILTDAVDQGVFPIVSHDNKS